MLKLSRPYWITNGQPLFKRLYPPIYVADDYRYYRVKSNLAYRHQTKEFDVTYYTNSKGLRTNHLRKDISMDKDEETFRFLFLGPSFTFGWANNYEDTYVSIIAENVVVKGKDIEIMNLGTPAQPIGYQLCWLQEIGYKFNPDFIVQTVYGGKSNLVNIPSSCQPELFHPPTVEDRYSYRSKITPRGRLIHLLEQSGIVFYGWMFYLSISDHNGNKLGLGTELYSQSTDGHAIRTDNYRDYISFVRKTVKREIPILFLHIPYPFVVRPDDSPRWQHTSLYENPLIARRTANEIETLLEQQGIPFVNTVNTLVAEDETTRMYYFMDIHFTPSGNKVVAEKVIPIMQELVNEDRN